MSPKKSIARIVVFCIALIGLFAVSAQSTYASTLKKSVDAGELSSPSTLPTFDSTQVVTGNFFTCALQNGGVQCWGKNDLGQLGDGTINSRHTSEYVLGLTTDVAKITAGGSHACALRIDGSVVCWGFHGYKQDAYSALDASIPIVVYALSTNVRDISAGNGHTCVLMDDESVKCWGSNYAGVLGDGTLEARDTPTAVSGLTDPVSEISAGAVHTCALTTSGTVYCWGENDKRQLGAESDAPYSLTPVMVPNSADAVGLKAGGYHTCILTTAGGVKCWGANGGGQLGDGTIETRLTPVDVVDLSAGVSSIALGSGHSCAITDAGAALCWGDNQSGRLGDGTTMGRATPVGVTDLITGVVNISGGYFHSCAVVRDSQMNNEVVKCWGSNGSGQLAQPVVIESSNMPQTVLGMPNRTTALAAGSGFRCALSESGEVLCWGAMDVDTGSLTGRVADLVAGDNFACALKNDGGVSCWGDNENGQLGNGTLVDSAIPVDVSGLENNIVKLSAGRRHACVLTGAGGIKCWGQGEYGKLGDGTNATHNIPVDVIGLRAEATDIAAGGAHTCALLDDATVQCWGWNQNGQLGDDTHGNALWSPVDVTGLRADAIAIFAGSTHTCAKLVDGGLQCWGHNEYGQLGNGTQTASFNEYVNTPVDVLNLSGEAVELTMGGSYTCALTDTGGVQCWGININGQLGDGTDRQDSLLPVDVSGLTSGVDAITVGNSHACALLNDGAIKCWGNYGILSPADGTVSNSLVPLDVTMASIEDAPTYQFPGPYEDCTQVVGIDVTDCTVLVTLYNETNGENWHYQYGWLVNNTPCSWAGITCTDERVTSISLEGNQLHGEIPLVLGQLSQLRELALSYNEFVGEIPVELGALTNLTTLSLEANELTGSIPVELGQLSALTELSLFDNELSGEIPAAIGQLSALATLNLGSNQLSGSIPNELGQLAALTTLRLSDNQLSGAIPVAFGQLTALTWLDLYKNQLSGSIPNELGQLTTLAQLGLYNNQLSGAIPAEFGQLTALTRLNLYNNQLSGSIPNELGQLTALTRLDLSFNQLSGEISAGLGQLKNLETLNLSNNQLSGNIPVELTKLETLGHLSLASNQLQGIITSERCLLARAYPRQLDLDYNGLMAANQDVVECLRAREDYFEWEQYQTVSPTSIKAGKISTTTVQLSWAPLWNNIDEGNFEVGLSVDNGETYNVIATIEWDTENRFTHEWLKPDKEYTFLVEDLDPDKTYTFSVRASTPAHEYNQNALTSEFCDTVTVQTMSTDSLTNMQEHYLPLVLTSDVSVSTFPCQQR